MFLMKLRKLLAASTAAAIALSATAFNVSAATVTSNSGIDAADGTADAVVTLFGENIDMLTEYGLTVDDVYGFEVVLDVTPEDVNGEAWIGGGIGTNSESTGWASTEWGQASGAKPIVLGEDGVITLLQEEPLFDSTDTYMQLWLQAWGLDVTVEAMSVLGADGEALISDIAEDDGDTATEAIAVNAANSPYTIMEGEAAIDMTKLTANIDLITDNANVNWNAWCNSTIAVTVNDVTEYFVFAGTQVSWDVTLNADTEDEVVIAPADFAAMADEGSIAVEMPVDISAGDDVTVEIIAQCWLDDTTGESAFAFTSLEIEEGEADGGDVEIDVWESYDLDAATAANEAFVFGTDTAIDLYALVGDSWTDLAKIDATFVWTPGLGGWCGGAGLGNGAVLEDGTNWISGPEYGAANANSAVEPDGTATQTIIDITGTPLADIVAVAEDGTVSYAHIQIQNWWNGVEAGAQLAALTAYDADGNVIGEITYDVEIPGGDASQDTDAPTDDKQSPDTGVEGIAAIAGVVALAGAAVVISRKRK